MLICANEEKNDFSGIFVKECASLRSSTRPRNTNNSLWILRENASSDYDYPNFIDTGKME